MAWPDVRRVGMITVHTSPLASPGQGDAGGLNVYVMEVAQRLAARGVEVELFTRATSASECGRIDVAGAPGVSMHYIQAGPYEGLTKHDLPAQLCAFAAGVMRAVASRPEGFYDVVHSHYWLSGQVGWLAADRWGVPLVHTMHTMARVKNAHLAEGDTPEPPMREIGEVQVVAEADMLVANTEYEARELVDLYDADPERVAVVHPGVDLGVFHPGSQSEARRVVGLAADAIVLTFIGRVQPLKAPDVLVRAAAELLKRRPELRERLVVPIVGGLSGSGLAHPDALRELAAREGVADVVRFAPPTDRPTLAQWYRASDVVAVPSYNESFGLVAVEAQACGTPVVAARVGGLPIAVGTDTLVEGHDPVTWSSALEAIIDDPAHRARLAEQAVQHAQGLSWDATADALLRVYAKAVESRQAGRAPAKIQALPVPSFSYRVATATA